VLRLAIAHQWPSYWGWGAM